MLYCTICAEQNDWPKNENKVHGIGLCEHCRLNAVLNFTPTAALILKPTGMVQPSLKRIIKRHDL